MMLKLNIGRTVKSTLQNPIAPASRSQRGGSRRRRSAFTSWAVVRIALPPSHAEDALSLPNSMSTSHVSSTYVSKNETQSQIGQLPYSYHHQPTSPTSTASTKLHFTSCTPLLGQQRGVGRCQSLTVNGDGEEVRVGRSSCASYYLSSSATGHSLSLTRRVSSSSFSFKFDH